MKRVYIAGPITKGDLSHNINQGTIAFIALAKAGIAPMCPMWSAYSGNAYTADCVYPQRVNAKSGDPVDLTSKVFAVAGANPNCLTHSDWLAVDFAWIRVCDAVLRLPGESVGADMETAEAKRLGIPVFESIDDIVRWA